MSNCKCHKKEQGWTIDVALMVSLGDLPAGPTQMAKVCNAAEPYFFPGGPICQGRLAVQFCSLNDADRAILDGLDETSAPIELTLEHLDESGAVVRSTTANWYVGRGDWAASISLESDQVCLGLVQVSAVDPHGFSDVAVAYVPDC